MIYMIILVVWELPQMLFGWIFYLITRKAHVQRIVLPSITIITFNKDVNSSVAFQLGKYIFLGGKYFNSTSEHVLFVLEHEYGHKIQSKYLGPLFLPLIAFPSIIWYSFYTLFNLKCNYYAPFFESWATHLGRNSDILEQYNHKSHFYF